MWECPVCGRTFLNENQHHFCGRGPETIDEYINEQDEKVRSQLEQVRNAIREVLPAAKEKISWQMPTFWQGKNIIHFAAAKHHIGIYPGAETVAFFKSELEKRGLKFAKGSIQIPYSENLPLDFIKIIAVKASQKIK